jgi:hypothetical protein
MAAGRLFVIVRNAPGFWAVEKGAVDLTEARALVRALLEARPGVRVVVADGIRSFTSSVTVTEDPQPVVEP